MKGGGVCDGKLVREEERSVWFLLIRKVKVIYRRITIIPSFNFQFTKSSIQLF